MKLYLITEKNDLKDFLNNALIDFSIKSEDYVFFAFDVSHEKIVNEIQNVKKDHIFCLDNEQSKAEFYSLITKENCILINL